MLQKNILLFLLYVLRSSEADDCQLTGKCPEFLSCYLAVSGIIIKCSPESVSLFNVTNQDILRHNWNLALVNRYEFIDLRVVEMMEKLRKLFVRGYRSKKIIFGEYKDLRHFALITSELEEIGNESFKGWKNIQNIDISGNSIKEIKEDSFERNTNTLRILNCSRNNISDTSFLKNLPKLEKLDLNFNNISHVSPEVFENLKCLKYLYLKSNRISNVNFLLHPPKTLRLLNLNGNIINDIPVSFLQNATAMTKIYLSGNRINYIRSGTFAGLERLKLIDLSYNKLTFIGEIFYKFNSSIVVHLDHNNLQSFNLDADVEIELYVDGNDWNCDFIKELQGRGNVRLSGTNISLPNDEENRGIPCFERRKSNFGNDTEMMEINSESNDNSFISSVPFIVPLGILLILSTVIIVSLYFARRTKRRRNKWLRMALPGIPSNDEESGYLTPKVQHDYEEIEDLRDSESCANIYYVSVSN